MALRFPTPAPLATLLPPTVALPPTLAALPIHGLSSDSRDLVMQGAFCAMSGQQHHGLDFYNAAVAAQAAVVLWEPPYASALPDGPVPLVAVPDLRCQLAALADRAVGQPSRRLHLIGITGTDGKTSCSHFLAQLLDATGAGACGVIGTLGTGRWPPAVAPTHTTPDALAVVGHLAEFVADDCRFAAMEVSSHALDQHRADGLHFAAALLTQISRDHLDYHGSLERYVAAKRRLFFDLAPAHPILNADDPHGAAWLAALPAAVAYGFSDEVAMAAARGHRFVRGHDLHLTADGLHFVVESSWGMAAVRVPLLGGFNGANVLGCLAALLALDQPLAPLVAQLRHLRPVCGRMEIVIAPTPTAPTRPLVVIDYAHTPHALEQALRALRSHGPSARLTVVFGCGGDRDGGKRPEMGAVAAAVADRVIVTSDNPRREAPAAIAAQILDGIAAPQRAAVHCELDRAAAIAYALDGATATDVVLIAGKGHENYQEINGLRRAFSDHAVVRAYFGETP